MINVIFIIFCKAVLVLKYKIIKKGFIKKIFIQDKIHKNRIPAPKFRYPLNSDKVILHAINV